MLKTEIHGIRTTLLAVASLAAVAPVSAQIAIEVDWSATSKLDHRIETIMVRRFDYRGRPVPAGVQQRDDALYSTLEQAIRREIQRRNAGITVLREDTNAIAEERRRRAEDAGEVAPDRRKLADAYILSSIRPETRATIGQEEKSVGERAAEKGLRKVTGGFLGGGGSHKKREKRSVSVMCNMSLVYVETGESIQDYAETENVTDDAQGRFAGIGRGSSSFDFEDELVIYQRLMERHAAAFVTRLLGHPGKKRFVLDGASAGCRDAALDFRAGAYSRAARRASSAFHRDSTAKQKHQACLVAGLAWAELHKADGNAEARRNAEIWLAGAIKWGQQCHADVADSSLVLAQLDTSEQPSSHDAGSEPSGLGTVKRGAVRPGVVTTGVVTTGVVTTGVVTTGVVTTGVPHNATESGPAEGSPPGILDQLPDDLRKQLEIKAAQRLLETGMDITKITTARRDEEALRLITEAVQQWLQNNQ